MRVHKSLCWRSSIYKLCMKLSSFRYSNIPHFPKFSCLVNLAVLSPDKYNISSISISHKSNYLYRFCAILRLIRPSLCFPLSFLSFLLTDTNNGFWKERENRLTTTSQAGILMRFKLAPVSSSFPLLASLIAYMFDVFHEMFLQKLFFKGHGTQRRKERGKPWLKISELCCICFLYISRLISSCEYPA